MAPVLVVQGFEPRVYLVRVLQVHVVVVQILVVRVLAGQAWVQV